MTTTVTCTCGRPAVTDWRTHGVGCPARAAGRLGVEVDRSPDQGAAVESVDRQVIRRMVRMLQAADHQPDPTVGGQLVLKAMLLGAAHLQESLASPWTEEEEGDQAADEDRIERRAAA